MVALTRRVACQNGDVIAMRRKQELMEAHHTSERSEIL